MNSVCSLDSVRYLENWDLSSAKSYFNTPEFNSREKMCFLAV